MINVYFHIATIGEYQHIHDEMIDLIIRTKLIENVDILKVCVVGNEPLEMNSNQKINYLRLGNIDEYEFPTLQIIEDDVANNFENFKVLYINGLGVTGNSVYKQSWRKYLCYFNIELYLECINSLESGFDVCGVDWRTDPVPHFSGNFWWANSSYLKTLPKIQSLNNHNSPIILTLRHNAEMYIGMNSNVNPRVIHQSNISQYERHLYTYDYKNYVNNIDYNNVIKKN